MRYALSGPKLDQRKFYRIIPNINYAVPISGAELGQRQSIFRPTSSNGSGKP